MKPRILVTRATFDDVIAKLRERFEVEDNQKDDAPWSAEEFLAGSPTRTASFPRVRTAWTPRRWTPRRA